MYYNGHSPSLAGNLIIAIIFAVYFIYNLIVGFRYKSWWFMNSWIFGLGLETIGYIGRVCSSNNINSFGAYVMQSSCITLAPCFLMAGIYYLIAQLTIIHGQRYSILKPKQYTWIFIISDVFAILLQASGGGIAASNSSDTSSDTGSHIMIGGLAFQVVSMSLFQIFWYLFLYKSFCGYKTYGDDAFNYTYAKIRKGRLYVAFLISVSIAVLTVYVRSIYRTIELAYGFDSFLSYEEIYVMILESLMILIACTLLMICHPAVVFRKVPIDFKLESGGNYEKNEAKMKWNDEPLHESHQSSTRTFL
ncbi:Rta1 protein [Martiniozyma asiatica (nom. inval.)]|nr:Rta1 protein [Martiniozyma asiatica]